jgi:hypothetical protein
MSGVIPLLLLHTFVERTGIWVGLFPPIVTCSGLKTQAAVFLEELLVIPTRLHGVTAHNI